MFIVGRDNEYGWDFQGVFDTEEKALAACRDEHYFIGPAELNKEYPDETIPWPGQYWPHRKD